MEITAAFTAGRFLSTALEQLGKRHQPREAAAGQTPETPATQASQTAGNAVLQEILASYDVTDMSPREFSEMLQKLYEAGALTDQELQELSLIRVDLDLEGVDPDKTLNLVDFYVEKINELSQSLDDVEDPAGLLLSDRSARLAPVKRRLEWLQKLAAVQSAPDGVGLDALA